MKKRSLGAALAAVVCMASLSTGVHAAGTDVKQTGTVPVTCAVGAGTLGINKSGSRVTLNFSVAGVRTGSGWRLTVTDSVAGVVARSSVATTTSSWSSIINYGSLKGTRTITVVAANISGTDHCSGKLTYKV